MSVPRWAWGSSDIVIEPPKKAKRPTPADMPKKKPAG